MVVETMVEIINEFKLYERVFPKNIEVQIEFRF